MTIGCIEDAEAALRGDGTFIGAGASREAYLINGIVYKVNKTVFESNEVEYANYLLRKDYLPTGVFFPLTNIFHVNGIAVIAMEYIEGNPVAECYCHLTGEAHMDDCMSPAIAAVVSMVIADISGSNTIVTPDGIYIIDIEN